MTLHARKRHQRLTGADDGPVEVRTIEFKVVESRELSPEEFLAGVGAAITEGLGRPSHVLAEAGRAEMPSPSTHRLRVRCVVRIGQGARGGKCTASFRVPPDR